MIWRFTSCRCNGAFANLPLLAWCPTVRVSSSYRYTAPPVFRGPPFPREFKRLPSPSIPDPKLPTQRQRVEKVFARSFSRVLNRSCVCAVRVSRFHMLCDRRRRNRENMSVFVAINLLFTTSTPKYHKRPGHPMPIIKIPLFPSCRGRRGGWEGGKGRPVIVTCTTEKLKKKEFHHLGKKNEFNHWVSFSPDASSLGTSLGFLGQNFEFSTLPY